MKVIKIDVGENRWHIQVRSNSQLEEVKHWVTTEYPDCFCKKYTYPYPYLELRGRDTAIMMMIVMRWA